MERSELVVFSVDDVTRLVLMVDCLHHETPKVRILDADLLELVVVAELRQDVLLFICWSFLQSFGKEVNASLDQLRLSVLYSVEYSF